MSLLTIMQEAFLLAGIGDEPTFVIGNTDPTVKQCLALLREECRDLHRRHDWSGIQKEGSFTTVAAELQDSLENIASDYSRTLQDTEWNRAFTQPIGSPITPQNWQEMKARLVSSPYYGMRIKQNPSNFKPSIYLLPTPTAGQTVYFEYISSKYILNAAGTAVLSAFAADGDTLLIPEHLAISGLRWRWKQAKGLNYAEDFNTHERDVAITYAQDGGGAPTLSMSGTAYNDGLLDNYNVPDGNWNV